MTAPPAQGGPAPLQAPKPPWSPFAPLPMDDEPAVASIRKRRLSDLMATVRFSAQPPEWQEIAQEAYTIARQAIAQASSAQMNGPAQARLSADLEKIRLQAGLKAGAQGAGEAETQTIARDQQYIPPSSASPTVAG